MSFTQGAALVIITLFVAWLMVHGGILKVP